MGNWEERVRERAFLIWLDEGQPHGQAERHWHMARRSIQDESSNDDLRSTGDSSEVVGTETSPTTEQPSLGDPVTAARTKVASGTN